MLTCQMRAALPLLAVGLSEEWKDTFDPKSARGVAQPVQIARRFTGAKRADPDLVLDYPAGEYSDAAWQAWQAWQGESIFMKATNLYEDTFWRAANSQWSGSHWMHAF